MSGKRPPDYGRLALIDLAGRIVDGDHRAIEELHARRRVFRDASQNPLLLTEFLELLEQELPKTPRFRGLGTTIFEEARDLTLTKFLQLPRDPESSETPGPRHSTRQGTEGIDCRNYFRAFMNFCQGKLHRKDGTESLAAEAQASRALQNLVQRQFLFSVLEAARAANPLRTRYNWRGADFWFPTAMPVPKRQGWLEENTRGIDLTDPVERGRVQEMIDHQVGHPREIRLSAHGAEIDVEASSIQSTPVAVADNVTAVGLRRAVAEEKCETIKAQRPAIQELGRKKLREMIVEIFEKLVDGDDNDVRLARKYGLSKATFSRFAGSQWSARSKEPRGEARIPDLWRNTAIVLSQHAIYLEAAKDAGVLPRVEEIIEGEAGWEGERRADG